MRKTGRATVVFWAGVAALLPAAVHAVPEVTARGAIIVDADTGAVIWEQNADEPLPPASTTKVMTAVLALQSHRLDQEFMVSSNAAATPPSKIGLRPGQSVALRDLLYAVLLKSANDAAVVVAEGVAGSEIEFAARMNLKARVVGATTTNFVNPHGLTEYGHVTTARDLSRIFRYGLGVPGFREVLSTTAADVFIDGPDSRLATVRSHNRLLNAPDYQVIGKTGYTRPARRCFVGAAGHGSREVVIAILGSSDLWGDARRMLYYGLSPDRPTPVLVASTITPPPPAVDEPRTAPPPAESEPPVAAAAAAPMAPQRALERAARMARARAAYEEPARVDDEPIAPGSASDEPAGAEPRRAAAPPAPVDDVAPRRPTLRESAHPDLNHEVTPETVEQPTRGGRTEIEERAQPAAGADEGRPVAPAVDRRPAASVHDDPEEPGAGDPDDPGALNDREPDRQAGPSLWAESPLRNPAREELPRGANRPEREVGADPARQAAQNQVAGAVAPPPRRIGSARAMPEERRAPAGVARIASEQSRKTARVDAQLAPARRRGDVSARASDDRGRRASGGDRRRDKEPSDDEPARTVARDRGRAESMREARADRRTTAGVREERAARRRPVVLAGATAAEARPMPLTARGLEVDRVRTTRTVRVAKRGAETEVADDARAAGKYTVQLGPYRDRKAVATARADLAKRGYEARVVGQTLELGTFAARSRADRLASQLRVSGHPATSAAARAR